MARWDFDCEGGAKLHVMQGTGHWSVLLNTATGTLGKSVYVYEAEVEEADGRLRTTPITRNMLRQARRFVESATATDRTARPRGQRR